MADFVEDGNESREFLYRLGKRKPLKAESG